MRISDWISDVCSSDLRHRHQRRPCRRDAGLLRQRQARRGRPLGRTETDPRRRAQVKLKSDPRPDETENEVNTLPALRLALLSSLGALALAACGDSQTDLPAQIGLATCRDTVGQYV